MKKAKYWQVLITLLRENKGYYLLSVLSSIPLVLLILSPKNFYAWGLFMLLIIRIIRFKKKSLLFFSIVILLVTGVITKLYAANNYTRLSMDIHSMEIIVDPNHLKIGEDSLSGTGKVRTGNFTYEKIVFYYPIRSSKEKEQFLQLKTTSIFHANVALKVPEKARNLYQFDYQNYLFYKGIHWSVQIKEMKSIKNHTMFLSKITERRMNFLQLLKNKIPNGKLLQYIQAMLFNQVDGIGTEVMDSYRKIGVIHLFSISGMHIQFLITYLKRMLLFLGITRETINPFLLLGIILYGILTGGSVGIFRAICINSILLVSEIVKRKIDPKDAFAFTMLFTLWFNPYLLFSISFQLSYALSGVLYLIAPRLKEIHTFNFIYVGILSFIMTIVSFPFLSYHFFEINGISMFVNILFSYFFSGYLFPIFWLVTLLAIIPFFSRVLFWISIPLQKILEITEIFSGKLAEIQWFLFVTGRKSFFYYLVTCILIIIFLILFEQKKKLFVPILIGSISFFIFHFITTLNPVGKVITLDVGQGDAILLISPFHQKIILIDTGGKVLFGESEDKKTASLLSHDKRLVSALKAEGIGKLDAVILTHNDFDHTGSLPFLSQEIQINHLYFPSGSDKEGILDRFLSERKNLKTNLHPVKTRDKITHGLLDFEVLWPDKTGKGENNDSIVLLSKIGGLVWLFTGDLEAEGETSLLRMYPNLTCDVLKIGHHGSKTSTSEKFIKQLNPATAIISSGKNNRYGHPHPDVLKRLVENNTYIFRTEEQGAIHFIYKGDKKTWLHVLQ